MKLGIIRVTKYLVEDSPKEVLEVFNLLGFLPVKVEVDFYNDEFLYSGTCESFNELLEGQAIPTYTAIIEKTDSRITSVRLERP